jgi:hypothetical protein
MRLYAGKAQRAASGHALPAPRQPGAIDRPRPALLPVGMLRHLPNALTLVFNRLALIPLQLKREAMPPKKRRPRRKRKPKRL